MRLLTAAVAGLIVGGLATAAILVRGRPDSWHVDRVVAGDQVIVDDGRPVLRVVG